MPIYEFECAQCGSRFEELMSGGGVAPACPSCGSKRTKRRLSPVSPPGRMPRGPSVRDSESRRREREAARRERLAEGRKGRKSS
jgi:putative FmdB family regulatory protein